MVNLSSNFTMSLYDQIRRISFVFFIVTGLAHFVSGFLFMNGYFAPTSGLVNRVLFIPFVLAMLTYALSNLKFHLVEYGKDSKTWTIAFISLGGIIFLVLLGIELLVVDSACPLSPTPCHL
ncbi:MAG: hypothetical protein AAB588_02135 [Patescibacteria group bacterium]